MGMVLFTPPGQWNAPIGMLPVDLLDLVLEEDRKPLLIQCGGAHLNHDPSQHRPDNLAWLCRGCHLVYDNKENGEERRWLAHLTRATQKDAARLLLPPLEDSPYVH